jgi:flagellar export protein FliJ
MKFLVKQYCNMAKFKFKYEHVKNAKEQLEKEVKKELAVINNQIDECISKQKSIAEEIELKKLKFKKNAKLHQLQFQKRYEANMAAMIDDLTEKIKLLKAQRQDKLTELIKRSKELKIFHSLKEKHEQKFIEEQNKIDMKGIDEIATQNYLRSK